MIKTSIKLAAIAWLAQTSQVQAAVLGDASRDSTLVEMKMYKVIGDRTPALADLPSSFPVALFNQKSTASDGTVTYTPIGFPIHCKGRDPHAVIRSFGDSFLDLNDAETVTEDDLNTLFNLSEQPVLRCDSLNGQNQVAPLFSQIYRVIDRAEQKSYHVVRFNTYSPLDKRLYELGCSNILDNFMNKNQPVIPVFKENLKDIPGADNLGALHCFNTAAALPQDKTVRFQPEPLPLDDAQLFRIQDPERGLLRVVLSDGKAFRINCSALDGELQKAWNLPVSGALPTLTPDDAAFAAYVNGKVDAQPTLDCPSLSRPEFASDAYQLMNQQNFTKSQATRTPWLRLKSKPDTLVQFGCESTTRFFVKNALAATPITQESSDFMVRNYVPGTLQTKKFRIGCGAEAQTPRLRDVQLAFIQVFGVPAGEAFIQQEANILKTKQKTFRFDDIVAYFANGMANTPYEANLITTRAFQMVNGRDPTDVEKAPLVDRILKFKTLRPIWVEVVLELKGQNCAVCLRDALTPQAQDIAAAFFKVFGVPVNTPWAQEMVPYLKGTLSSYQLEDVVDYLSSGMAMSEFEVGVITQRAFKAARWRDPTADEKAFFIDSILTQKKMRPHFIELMAYLESIEDLPRQQLVDSYMETMNHASDGGMKWWTFEMFSHPGQVYTYPYAIEAHVGYLSRDEGKDTLNWVIDMAIGTALAKESKPAWKDKILRWIKVDRVVRAHYKELVNYIGQRRGEFN